MEMSTDTCADSGTKDNMQPETTPCSSSDTNKDKQEQKFLDKSSMCAPDYMQSEINIPVLPSNPNDAIVNIDTHTFTSPHTQQPEQVSLTVSLLKSTDQTLMSQALEGNVLSYGEHSDIVDELVKLGATVNVSKIINIEHASIATQNTNIACEDTTISSLTSQNTQIGSDNTISTNEIKVSKEQQRLFEKTKLQINDWQQNEGKMFICPPAFEICQQKLKNTGHVTLFGLSGDGKTTLAYEILLKSTRQAIIVRHSNEWEAIDLDAEKIILFDDMLGRFVLDDIAKQYWVKELKIIYAAVRSGKLQVVITCRETVFSACKKELEDFELFYPASCIFLSGPDSECCLTVSLKLEMVEMYIKNAKHKIGICHSQVEEMLSKLFDDECKISSKTLAKISEMGTCLGFPQCCRIFTSTPECFARGVAFFRQPTEVMIKEIDRMRESVDEREKFNYCTLACVLIYGELTDETIDNIDDEGDIIKDVAEACRIPRTAALSGEIQNAAQRLTASYLDYTREKYTLRHNSLLEVVFTSFFRSQPRLLLEHCSFDLLEHLITSKDCKEKSVLFCELPKRFERKMCARLAREVMEGNIKHALSHRVLSDIRFAEIFCAYIDTSDKKYEILQSTKWCWCGNVSILGWSAEMLDESIVKHLMEIIRVIMSEDKMKEEFITALVMACYAGRYKAYRLFASEPGVAEAVTGECLWWAALKGSRKMVDDLLNLRKWRKKEVSDAMGIACLGGNEDVYRSLAAQVDFDGDDEDQSAPTEDGIGQVKHMVDDLLKVAQNTFGESGYGNWNDLSSSITQSGGAGVTSSNVPADSMITANLLKLLSWDPKNMSDALYVVCWFGYFPIYKSIISYYHGEISEKCLLAAALSRDRKIIADLRDRGYIVPDL